MFVSTYQQFWALRASVRSLVFLYWIYAFTGSMVNVFVQVFLYQKFTSLELNVIATIVYYTGVMLGFCVPGVLAALLGANIKRGFFWSFVFMGASIAYLLSITDVWHAYLAMLLWGFGQGIFWLTVNTFELAETQDRERDFYSSALNAGNQILGLLGPAFATVLIWLSGSVLGLGTYTLLFTVSPAIFLLGFFCFANIRDYRPPGIRLRDISHYFRDRRNQAAQLYTLGTGFAQTLGVTIPPLVVFLILGTALRVGIYDTIFALFSALCIIAIARYRTRSNRIMFLGITMLGIALATLWLGYALTLAVLIIYTIVTGLLSPIMNVSSHVIDLGAMEVGRSDTDFYATMILRDFFLWVWRGLGGLALLALIGAVGAKHSALSLGLYMLSASLVVTFIGAYLFVRLKRA